MGNVRNGVTPGTVKSWVFKLITFPVMGVIYWVVIAGGLRLLIPDLGVPLYKILPGVTFLRHYAIWNKFDLANCLALVLSFFVFILWLNIMRLWLHEEMFFIARQLNPEKYAVVLMLLGVIILGADCLLFYFSMANQSWTGGGFSFVALLITIAYTGIVMAVSFVCVTLEAEGDPIE